MNAWDRNQLAHQNRQIFSNQRLAASNAQLRDAERNSDTREPLDLLEAEDLFARHVLDALFGHAVEAPYVATVGHADSKTVVNDGRKCPGAAETQPLLYREHALDR